MALLITGYGDAYFFLTLPLIKYPGFVLKDALCKDVFQKAKGLTMFNTCSGILGALLTK